MLAIPDGLHLYQLTQDRLDALWLKVRQYDSLFSDETRGDKVAWVASMIDPKTVILETDDRQGLFFLKGLWQGLRGEVHAIFFDHKLSPRTFLAKQALIWAFVEFDLARLGASIPAFSRALRRWMLRLGFRQEGYLRHDFRYRGKLADSVLLGILREEVFNGSGRV